MRAGDTFLMHLPGSGNDPYYHMFIVVTDPEPDSGRIVAVMVRTAKDYTDKTVILQKGDHPFIKHPSAVQYSSADIFSVSKIEKAFEKVRAIKRKA